LWNLEKQGLVTVPFWVYWTSPEIVAMALTIYHSWLGDVQWGHLMTHDKTLKQFQVFAGFDVFFWKYFGGSLARYFAGFWW
jgi:hypothetical protein